LKSVAEECFFSPEQFIYREDEYNDGVSNALYLVLKGDVELYYDYKDNANLTINTIKAGKLFNSRSFFSDEPDDFSASKSFI